jgi:hypothetical protein
MRVEFLNIFYFTYIFIAIFLTILSIYFLKNKSDRFKKNFIIGIIFANLFVHFFKIFIFPYTEVEYIWTKVSFENICAVSALTFPFLYFSKNKTLKDYMILVGMSSGIITFLFPVDAMSNMFNGEVFGYKTAFQLENIRFYLSHYLIFLAPFLMVHFKQHTLSFRRMIYAPLLLIVVLFVIYLNELIITAFGWVDANDLYNPEKRNPSFIFGIRGDIPSEVWLLFFMVPRFMTVHPTTLEPFFWPVLWQVFPVIFYGSLISFIYMFIYDKDNTILFIKRIPRFFKKEVLKSPSEIK